jgi:FkbM family methyltransferase
MNELVLFATDTENPEKNYNLAEWYDNQGHNASAHTYYLRAAERAEDKLLAYTSLLRASISCRKQSTREVTEKSLIHSALSILPERPEAYYFLCLMYGKNQEWDQVYTYSILGLNCYDKEIEPIDIPDYEGKYLLVYQKAISSWWWGKMKESRDLFHSLVDEYWNDMNSEYRALVENEIMHIGLGPNSQSAVYYDKSKFNQLRFKFDNSDIIEKNYSQVLQDIFVLSVLDGKNNGTFLEIGGAKPFDRNNTALLEEKFNWRGVSIELDETFVKEYTKERPKTKVLNLNALDVNYEKLLNENFQETTIDYLQLDIEPARNTYECMLKIPFDKYKFAVITYEHDYYIDVTRSYRQKSRDFLKSKGYVLVVNDISPDGISSFEDWWVHPDLVDKKIINIMKDENENTKNAEEYIFCNNPYIEKMTLEEVEKKESEVISNSSTAPEFDWGNLNEEYVQLFTNENFVHRTYEKHQEVKPNDIVFDVGANYGSFTYSILDKKPKEVYCIEPSNTVIDFLRKNVSHGPVTFINKAISDKEEINSIPENGVYIYDHEGNSYSTTTFEKIIKEYNISKIDFLKFDCEGGEYSIFTKDNYEFIRNNVTNFAGEWHINDHQNAVERFIEFRNLYLNDCSDLHVYERNGKDVTKDIFNDQYLYDFSDFWKPTFLGQFMIYFSYGSTSKFNFMTNSKSTSWIVDNFYDNPDEIRKFALEQEFDEGGFGKGFIGRRTKQQFLFPNLKEKFEEIMGRKITAWQEHGMNGRFQIAWSGEPLVYHCDSQKWGGMLYLTPNAPYQCGTTLYAHKQTRARTYYEEGWDAAWKDIPGECHLDGTPWEPVDVLGNVYNRLVIFDASAIHSASEYFGTVMENARLWQMFFFDTED